MYSKDITTEIIVQSDNTYRPLPYEVVKVEYQGEKYATVEFMERTVKTHIKKIDAFHYKDLKTGEIRRYREMTKGECEKIRIQSMRRAFRDLKGLIRTNFVAAEKMGENAEVYSQSFITLTYRENMTDTKRLYNDFDNFMDRLIKAYPHNYEYIAVVEPQGRGAWHIHLMIKSAEGGNIWIDRKKLTELWRHGATTIKLLKSDDVGAYYTAYFTGLFATQEKNQINPFKTGEEALAEEQMYEKAAEAYSNLTGRFKTEAQKRLKKAHIKGARLSMYPKNIKFYRCSRNIKRPNKAIKELFGLEDEGYKKIYDHGYKIDKITTEKLETGESKATIKNLNRIYNATYKSSVVKEEIKVEEHRQEAQEKIETYDQFEQLMLEV